MKSEIRKISALGWDNCFSLKSGPLEVIATANIGPRIVFFGLAGGQNLLKIYEGQAGRTGDETYLFYGGHRVWAAPEDPVLTYYPDNDSVDVSFDDEDGFLTFSRPADESHLERWLSMRVATDSDVDKSAEVGVPKKESGILGSFVLRNKIINRSKNPIKTASWGISSFIPGGIGFMPLNRQTPPEKRLQAQFSINIWPYSSLSNPAYQWEDKWLEIDQSKTIDKQKIGAWNQHPWLAYRLGEMMVVIQMFGTQKEQEQYPDLGSNSEIYFDPDMLELEFLSAWQTLATGESVSHDELWSLIKLPGDIDDESAIHDYVYPLVKE